MTTQTEKDVIISQRPPEYDKLPELAEEILDILGDASVENNAIAYHRDGFQYMIFFSEENMVVCASKVLKSEAAIKHDSVLNQFNLRSRFGACSICLYYNKYLFFYRGEVTKEDIFESGDLAKIIEQVENEVGLEYEVLNCL